MTPGTILFDYQFLFQDGTKGKKLFIVLNNGSNGTYITVKTTSQSSRYGINYGCQILDRFPNFYFVKGSCCLSDNTWVQLDCYYEFKSSKLMKEVMSNAIRRIGVLQKHQVIELLHCVSHSEDLSLSNEKIIQSTLASL